MRRGAGHGHRDVTHRFDEGDKNAVERLIGHRKDLIFSLARARIGRVRREGRNRGHHAMVGSVRVPPLRMCQDNSNGMEEE